MQVPFVLAWPSDPALLYLYRYLYLSIYRSIYLSIYLYIYIYISIFFYISLSLSVPLRPHPQTILFKSSRMGAHTHTHTFSIFLQYFGRSLPPPDSIVPDHPFLQVSPVSFTLSCQQKNISSEHLTYLQLHPLHKSRSKHSHGHHCSVSLGERLIVCIVLPFHSLLFSFSYSTTWFVRAIFGGQKSEKFWDDFAL